MKMKKKTKKLLIRTLVIFLCFMMLLPLVANIIVKPTGQEMLMNELLKAQIESQMEQENEDSIEGNYMVTEVASADTYKILWGDEERTVKLIGVRGDKNALDEVCELVEARILSLQFDTKEEDEDGNLLAYAYLEDGEFLNEKLVREGLATVNKDPDNTRYDSELESAQVHAKNNHVGVWAD